MNEIDHELESQGLRLVVQHIKRVQWHMQDAVNRLGIRAVQHDQSKYSQEELGLVLGKPSFDKYEYMSVEERAALAAVQESLKHHYAVNSHHPEHYEDGILGMSLLDLLEMLADWKAASETSGKNSSFQGSIEFAKERWNLSPEMARIFENTGRELGWIE